MSKHHVDLLLCRKQPGIAIGKLCDKCRKDIKRDVWGGAINAFFMVGDGKCCVCDSYVRPHQLARICDECNFGSLQGRCILCGGPGTAEAFYCRECCLLEKDREGCPKIVNVGSARVDMFYEKKRYHQQKGL